MTRDALRLIGIPPWLRSDAPAEMRTCRGFLFHQALTGRFKTALDGLRKCSHQATFEEHESRNNLLKNSLFFFSSWKQNATISPVFESYSCVSRRRFSKTKS